ncbi:MDR family MFS transporter [Streptomyces iconiensis]|uniref:MFS transporter n=1 Tax=Streptomyces iconiensis TaxID=1384038 RepID=A0ABT7A3I9_9ACTN|nr:MFS transporter [Streptomyces iconiensis]MDJ1135841.1 MFS transporter [Streptomyces iconiensis]
MAASTSFSGLRRAATESVGGLPRQFWWLWLSTLVNRLGGFVATFLALYLTVERGYSASYAGLVGALYGLGGVVASIGAGVLTDRLGRRPTMLIAQLSTAASIAALGLMTHPVAIAAVACVVGMASNASRPAVQAMMADIVKPEDRVRAFSLNYWAINLGFAVSSASAGLIAQYSYHLLFFTEATMVLACAVVVFVKLPESRPVREEKSGGPQAGGDPHTGTAGNAAGTAGTHHPEEPDVSMWTVLRDGRFMTVVALSLLMATLIQQAFVAMPISMGEQGFSSADFGTVIALNGVMIVLLQLPVTRLIQHRSPSRVLIVSALLTGYGFGLNAFAGSVVFFAMAVLVWTLGEMMNTPTQMGLVVRFSPTHGRGRYQGMYNLSWALASLGAPLVGGYVIDHFGSATLWSASAAIGTIAALGYWLLLRDEDDEPAPEPEPTTATEPEPGRTPAPTTETTPAPGTPDEPTAPRTDSVA